jgi:hypothetical protein
MLARALFAGNAGAPPPNATRRTRYFDRRAPTFRSLGPGALGERAGRRAGGSAFVITFGGTKAAGGVASVGLPGASAQQRNDMK